MPTIASNALSVAYGNFSAGYQILDRAGITLLRDPLTSKGSVLFYTTKRVGGDVINKEAIKIGKIAS
jgi:HK97 family phage major capsid protein